MASSVPTRGVVARAVHTATPNNSKYLLEANPTETGHFLEEYKVARLGKHAEEEEEAFKFMFQVSCNYNVPKKHSLLYVFAFVL